jgi:acyl carrier protein
MEDLEKKVIDIISKQLPKSKDITLESNFAEDLGADSLDLVELIMTFEEEFDIEVMDDVAETLTSVQKVVDHVRKMKS